MAHQSYVRKCRTPVLSYLSSTWGRADQHTLRDSKLSLERFVLLVTSSTLAILRQGRLV